MPIKAIVADDHPLFRLALKQAIIGILGDEILEADSFQASLDLLAKHADVELVFLDIKMPGNAGLTGLTTLRSQYPDILVLIVSAEENPNLVRKAIDFGASAYIPKSTPLPEIAAAIRDVLEGKIWLPNDISQQVSNMANLADQAFANKLAQLTPHQYKVLQMLAEGLLNKQIAYELQVSESTIKQHVSAVLHKLALNNRTQAGVLFKECLGNTDEAASD
ncbi:MAG: response regulator transcription factor [Paraglaciecola sp.]|nr:response regulator transcription factor [Paraglaciecola sp.]NCT49466.1 response regulator transcription factor [Paraglaciecola sp.]